MKLNKRGVIVMWALVILIVLAFTYLTRDVCYVGNMPGNTLGYGSCSKMIDLVISK
jgi:PDZ domain-containing secreted protein